MKPRKIYKYPLQVISEQQLEVHAGFQPLSAQFQLGKLQLWGIDPETTENIFIKVYVIGTGHEVPADAAHYAGTVQQYDGAFIWHVFTTSSAHVLNGSKMVDDAAAF